MFVDECVHPRSGQQYQCDGDQRHADVAGHHRSTRKVQGMDDPFFNRWIVEGMDDPFFNRWIVEGMDDPFFNRWIVEGMDDPFFNRWIIKGMDDPFLTGG